MCVYLRAKFQASNTTVTSFRQGRGVGIILPPPNSKHNPKNPTQIKFNLLFMSMYGFNHAF